MTEKYVRYYFVDYENVRQAGLNGIDKLSGNEKVIIFYTPANETLTFGMYKKMAGCKADIELYRIQTGGKDALNFQLCTFLGYAVGNNPEAECCIISDDASYEYVVSFWKNKGVEVIVSHKIINTVQHHVPENDNPDAENAEPVEKDFDIAVKSLNLSPEDKKRLYGIYCGSGQLADTEQRLMKLQQVILKHFGIGKVNLYYNALEPLIRKSISDSAESPDTEKEACSPAPEPEETTDNNGSKNMQEAIENLSVSQKSEEIIYQTIANARNSYPDSKSQQCSYIRSKMNYLFDKGVSEKICTAVEPYI